MTTLVPTFRVYRGVDNILDNTQNPNTWRASATYVTGAHNMKFGYQGAYHVEQTTDLRTTPATPDRPRLHRARACTRPTMRIAPWQQSNRTEYHAFYAQDQWTHRPHDAAGRAALRPRVELVPGRAQRRAAGVASGTRRRSRSRETDGRHRLQRHHAARRRRLRRVRQRQDVAEGERRQVSAEREQPGELHDQQPGARRPQRPPRPELPDDGARARSSTSTATTCRTATCC